jgi:hypothetical protein
VSIRVLDPTFSAEFRFESSPCTRNGFLVGDRWPGRLLGQLCGGVMGGEFGTEAGSPQWCGAKKEV